MIETEVLHAIKQLSCSDKKLKQLPRRNQDVRSVKFSAQERHVREFEVRADVPKEELWYTTYEYESIKSQSRIDAREWRKMGYVSLLKDTFYEPRLDAQNYINVFCTLNETLSRRGLERHCSRKHGDERSDSKDRARFAVLSTQERLTREGMLSKEEIVFSVAITYSSFCRDSKIFARRLAKADEIVALGTDVSQRVLDEQFAILSSCRSTKFQRRLSNYSSSTTGSMTSFGSSHIGLVAPTPYAIRAPLNTKRRYITSPTSNSEELYAAMA